MDWRELPEDPPQWVLDCIHSFPPHVAAVDDPVTERSEAGAMLLWIIMEGIVSNFIALDAPPSALEYGGYIFTRGYWTCPAWN